LSRSQKKKVETDKSKSESIIALILAKGGWENPLGIPGWRWFQFDTNVDTKNWYVSDEGKVKAGEYFTKSKEIKLE